MISNPFHPRYRARKRIIYRNGNPVALKLAQSAGLLGMLALFPVGFGTILGLLPLWALAMTMTTMIVSIAVYAVLWFSMLDKMKNSTRDRKFVRKMTNDEFWQ